MRQQQNPCSNALIFAISSHDTNITPRELCKTFGTVIAQEGNLHPSITKKVVPVLRFLQAF